MKKNLIIGALALGAIVLPSVVPANAATNLNVSLLSTIQSGSGELGAEIPAYHVASKRIFATNGATNQIDIYDIANPSAPKKLKSVSLSAYGNNLTSVAAGLEVVVAVVGTNPTFAADGSPILVEGKAVVLDRNGKVLSSVSVKGFQPDAVTFTPDGKTAIVAIEAEPICALDNAATTANESLDYAKAVDGDGGVAIINLSSPKSPRLKRADFSAFSVTDARVAGLVINKTVNSVAKDVEPEYVTAISNTKAFVTLQEANGIAEVNLSSGKVTKIYGAAVIDRGVVATDLSDKDKNTELVTYPGVRSNSQPDAIASFQVGKDSYFATAGEGDAREWTCLTDDLRGGKLTVDAGNFPTWATQKVDAILGRAKVDPNAGDFDLDGDVDYVTTRGSRSMSIFKNGQLLWDSGSLLEKTMIEKFGFAKINGSHVLQATDKTLLDYIGQDRSDDKGPEPEGVAVGLVGKSRIAVLGLERTSSLVFFDITNPANPVLVSWQQMQPLETTTLSTSSAWSPEGVIFISADKSPTKKPLVITSYEMSGSLTIHQLGN